MVIGRKVYPQFLRLRFSFPYATIFFYLLKESLPPIFLSFSILTMLVFSQQIARNLEFLLSPFSTWQASSQILLNLLPGVIVFTLPISLLVGTTITLSKLSAESEWVAMEALALRRWPRVLPFALLGVLGTALLLQLTWQTAPRAVAELRNLRELITFDQAALQIRPRTFIKDIPNHLLQIKSIDRQTGMWKGVLLIKQDPQTKNMQVIAARRGIISKETAPNSEASPVVEIKLQEGVSLDKLLTPQQHESVSFKEYTYKLTLNQSRGQNGAAAGSPNEIGSRSTTRLLRQVSNNSLPANETKLIGVEIQRRFILSFACLFAIIVACLLNFSPGQRTAKNLYKLVVGFFFCILFYTSLSATQAWVLAGKLPAAGLMWLGGIFSLLMLILFWLVQPHLKNYLNRMTRNLPLAPKAAKAGDKAVAPAFGSAGPKLASFFNLVNYLLLSEVAKFFVVALGILVGTVLLFTLLDISTSLSKNNIKVDYALGYLFLLSPQMAYYFAPFAVMLALVATAAALARTGQLGVLFYYAQNLPRILVSMLFFSLLVLGGMHLLSEVILPTTNREQDERFRRIKGRKTEDITSAIAFDRKWVLDQNENIAGFKVTNLGNRAEQFDVLQLRLKEENYYLQEILSYPQASANPDKTLYGIPTYSYSTDAAGLARLQATPAQPTSLNLSTNVLFNTPPFEASKMSLGQLKLYIREVERVGLSVTSLKMDKAQRLTFPVACLSLACLAFPLAFAQIRRSQRGGLLMVGLGIVLALCFWAALSLFETAGKNGLIPIDLAAWAPHGLFISLAAVLHAKLNAT